MENGHWEYAHSKPPLAHDNLSLCKYPAKTGKPALLRSPAQNWRERDAAEQARDDNRRAMRDADVQQAVVGTP